MDKKLKQVQFAKLVKVSPAYISTLIKNNKLSTLKNGEICEHIGLLEFTLLKLNDDNTKQLLSAISTLITDYTNDLKGKN